MHEIFEALGTSFGARGFNGSGQDFRQIEGVIRDHACAFQWVHDGHRFASPARYRQGVGLFAATLLRAGIPVIAQRDFASLERLLAHLDPDHVPDPTARDHHQHPWCVEAFAR